MYDAVYKDAYDVSYQRFYARAYHHSYERAYDQALADAVSRITDAKIDDIMRLRSQEKMGWGKIAQMYGVHPGVLGLGTKEVFTVDNEIEVVTRIDTRTGWGDETVFNSDRYRDRRSAAEVGLTQTSSMTFREVTGKNAGWNGKNSKSANTDTSSNSRASHGVSSGKGKSGKSKDNNGGNGNSKGNGSAKGSQGGNSGGKGGNGKKK